MTQEENKSLIRRQVDEAWNRGNLAILDDIMAADVLHHELPPGVAPGLEGFKQLIAMHRKAFSDLRVTIEDNLAEGDRVANRWTWSGTHRGVYLGITPTGKKVSLRGISIHRIEGGEIVEQWHEMDMLGLMRQLGLLPTYGNTGA